MLTLNEVCKITNYSRKTIYKIRCKGGFPEPIILSERRLLWREEEIEAWFRGEFVPKPTKEIAKTVVKRFAKPEPLELANYFLEKGSSKEEAEIFFNYYESNGWKVGKNVMKNWKAAASGWIKRNAKSGQGAKKPNKHEARRAKNRAALEAAQRAVRESGGTSSVDGDIVG